LCVISVNKEQKKHKNDSWYRSWIKTGIKFIFPSFSDDRIGKSIFSNESVDKLVDAIIFDKQNKKIYLIKCIRDPEKENVEVDVDISQVKSFRNSHNKLLSPKNNLVYNLNDENIISNYRNFSKIKYKREYKFLVLGRVKNKAELFGKKNKPRNIKIFEREQIEEKLEDYLSFFSEDPPEEIEVEFVNTRIGTKSKESIPVNLNHVNQKIGNHYTFIGIISGTEIVKIRKKFRYSLFDSNIRFFLKESEINRGIIDTARSEPEFFYFYNNGITTTASKFQVPDSKNKIKLKNPQIINGAQTVDSIFSAYEEMLEKEGEPKTQKHFQRLKVLLKVVQTRNKNAELSEFENKVIQYTNSLLYPTFFLGSSSFPC